MRYCNHGRFRQQVRFLRRQFLQDGDLPFATALSETTIAPALQSIEASWKDRVFSPLVTLWTFLSQVLSADHSCRAAVARLLAHRVSQGESACSANTGAYCQARKRLPEKFFSAVACLVGRALDAKAHHRWLWKGRRVYMFDGTTVTMPDTPENQSAYPQVYNQKPGLGFPIARLGALTSLSCGAIVNLGFCRYAGKGHSTGVKAIAVSIGCSKIFRATRPDPQGRKRVTSTACFRHDDQVDASSGAFARLSRKGSVYCVPSLLLIERPTLKPLGYRFDRAGAGDFAGDRGAFCK